MELEHVWTTPTVDPFQLHIVVGGEFASTVGDDGCDNVADTSVQDMGVVGTDEIRVLGELGSHADLLPSTGSESISSSHTAGSIR